MPDFGPKPHQGLSYGLVYANDIAREAIRSESAFPSGAIIVREKFTKLDSTFPDLLAVMIKREMGFNPPANDWEFLVLNGTASRVRRREKIGSCQDCHSKKKEKDFVFGDYAAEGIKASSK